MDAATTASVCREPRRSEPGVQFLPRQRAEAVQFLPPQPPGAAQFVPPQPPGACGFCRGSDPGRAFLPPQLAHRYPAGVGGGSCRVRREKAQLSGKRADAASSRDRGFRLRYTLEQQLASDPWLSLNWPRAERMPRHPEPHSELRTTERRRVGGEAHAWAELFLPPRVRNAAHRAQFLPPTAG